MAYEGRPGSAFVDLDIVQKHIGLAADMVGDSAAREYRVAAEGSLRYFHSLRFDSPLEVLFWIWWDAGMGRGPGSEWFDLRPQQEVTVNGQNYRVDFLLEPTNPDILPNWKPIAIEVDGHEFHERTPEQVQVRDSRDRALQAAGWRVFHFSFREFTARPLECVAEAFVFAKAQRQASF